MSNAADVIIVGSGPAGVSAAFPLLEQGLRVLMLDAGTGPVDATANGTFRILRETDPEQWRLFLGEDFYGLGPQRNSSPKLRAPANAHVFAGFEQSYRIATDNFAVAGSLTTGGLSNAWGAGVSCLSDTELSDFPFKPDELRAPYRGIAGRVGISGSADDDMSEFHGLHIPIQPPSPLGENAARLLARYEANSAPARRQGLRLGHARNAVLTQDMGARRACESCAMCLWGCAYRSIYSAAYDLAALKKKDNFRYRGNLWVENLDRHADGYAARCLDRSSGAAVEFTVPRVLLACGTIGTAKLVLQSLGLFDHEVPLLSNPTLAFALWLPARLGAAVEGSAFGLSQLTFEVVLAGAEGFSAYGNMFGTDGLLASDFIGYLPGSRRAAVRLVRLLAPSLLVANCFLPGEFGGHRLCLRSDGVLYIKGMYSPGLPDLIEKLQRRLVAGFRRYGAWVLPGSFKLTVPGEDIHYAGTVPMCRSPLPHQSGANGEIAGLPGVYVVDGSALPRLSAKPLTLTIMANAERIARQIAQRVASGVTA